MTSNLAHLDPQRLAEAVALAAGAVPAESDAHLCDLLLERLCHLVSATSGIVVAADGMARVVHAAHRCRPDRERTPLPAMPLNIPILTSLTVEPTTEIVSVPLLVGDNVVGGLEVGRADGVSFTGADRAVLDVVSPRLAFLIERHRLQGAEKRARNLAADAVETLRLKEQHLEAMCDGAFGFIGLTSLDGRVLEVNRAALDFAGVARAEVLDRLFWETPWWAHDAPQRERLRRAMASAAAGRTVEFVATHVSPSGTVATVDFAVRPSGGKPGRPAHLVVEGRDVTVRHEAQRALADRLSTQTGQLAATAGTLEEAQALYKAVIETIVDGIVVIDERGIIEWTNAAATRLFGHAAADMVGKSIRVLMPAPYEQEHDEYLRRYLTTGERKIIGIGRDVRGLRKDGTTFPLYLAVGETTLDGTRKFTGILRDLSANKRLEQMLQERQTLARIGELAAVVAHEVRNPLAAIRGVIEVIQTRFASDSPDRRVLGDLIVRVDSLDQLVGDLLVYSRPAPPVFRRTNVLALVRETVALLDNEPTVTSVRFEITGDEDELDVDSGQLGRALLNLMTNAAQAMKHTGVVRVVGERSASRFRLTIDDEGPGMPPEVLEKCFEPFFTTKTRGTGLGLPIAKRVIDEHGGTCVVARGEKSGTRVVIELPVVREVAAE